MSISLSTKTPKPTTTLMIDLPDEVMGLEFHLYFAPSRLCVFGVRGEEVVPHLIFESVFVTPHTFTLGGSA